MKCWLDRYHAYKNLIKLEKKRIELGLFCATKKKTMNIDNIKCTALRNGIKDPLYLSLEQLVVRSKECKEHYKRLMAEAP